MKSNKFMINKDMKKYILKNFILVNDQEIKNSDVLIINDKIERIDSSIDIKERCIEIVGEGKYLFPAIIIALYTTILT